MSIAEIIEDTKQEAFLETFGEQMKIFIRKAKRGGIKDNTIVEAFQNTFKVDTGTAEKLYAAINE